MGRGLGEEQSPDTTLVLCGLTHLGFDGILVGNSPVVL